MPQGSYMGIFLHDLYINGIISGCLLLGCRREFVSEDTVQLHTSYLSLVTGLESGT